MFSDGHKLFGGSPNRDGMGVVLVDVSNDLRRRWWDFISTAMEILGLDLPDYHIDVGFCYPSCVFEFRDYRMSLCGNLLIVMASCSHAYSLCYDKGAIKKIRVVRSYCSETQVLSPRVDLVIVGALVVTASANNPLNKGDNDDFDIGLKMFDEIVTSLSMFSCDHWIMLLAMRTFGPLVVDGLSKTMNYSIKQDRGHVNYVADFFSFMKLIWVSMDRICEYPDGVKDRASIFDTQGLWLGIVDDFSVRVNHASKRGMPDVDTYF